MMYPDVQAALIGTHLANICPGGAGVEAVMRVEVVKPAVVAVVVVVTPRRPLKSCLRTVLQAVSHLHW